MGVRIILSNREPIFRYSACQLRDKDGDKDKTDQDDTDIQEEARVLQEKGSQKSLKLIIRGLGPLVGVRWALHVISGLDAHIAWWLTIMKN